MDKTGTGRLRMVDVGEKEETERIAVASGTIRMKRETLRAVMEGRVPKGDVIGTARLAGIMAAKRTPELIPLCHPVRLTTVEVSMRPDTQLPGIYTEATVRARDRTGVEMEALTAVAIGLLSAYDMLKGIDRTMEIVDVHLDRKEGGRTGRYVRESADVRNGERLE